METKVNAIVLRTVDYKDNDKMLTLFTMEKGIIGAGIKGVKKSTAKLKFAAEPFGFSEYVLSVSGERNTVIEASQIDSFYNIRLDFNKYYVACAVTEYLRQTLIENVPSEELFMLTCNTFKALAYSNSEAVSVLIKFLFEAVKISGYGFSVSDCGVCGAKLIDRVFFDFDDGTFVCDNCRKETDLEMNLNTYKLLGYVSENKLENLPETFDLMIKRKALRFMDYYVKTNLGVELTTLSQIQQTL